MADNLFQDVFVPDNFASGKEGGASVLAEMPDFLTCIVAEYVWVDAEGRTRSKCKTVDAKPEVAEDCSIWCFNGAATGQANSKNSDVYLVPRKVFDDPVRGAPHVLVVCEAISASMEPAAGNWRAECAEVLEKYQACDPWFGFEQEYVLCDEEGEPCVCGHEDDTGMFYCGRGAQSTPKYMRDIMGDHYAMCMRGGIKISGMNLEAIAGQGEFQIGPCKGINIGDHMIAARHILHKAANKYRRSISFKATHEELVGGSGMHANLSTRQTRGDGGLDVIEKIAKGMGAKHKDALAAYGEGNIERMSGKNLSPDMGSFRFGVADRTASVRVPRGVGIVGKGYLEDRRPSANADPYRVTMHLMRVLGLVLYKNVPQVK